MNETPWDKNLELAREQEENLIGSLLKHPDHVTNVSEIIKPEDIYTHSLKIAVTAMFDLHASGLKIDSVTLGDELEKRGVIKDFVVRGHCGRLALQYLRTEYKGDHPESYANKILGYSAKRTMLREFNTGAAWAFNGRNAEDIRDDMIRRLTNIRVPNALIDKHTQTFPEALSQNYDEVNNGNVHFVPTGFIDLDRTLDGGLYAPDFMVLAGRPGRGKTSLLLSIALNAAQAGKRVAIFSLEMSNNQVIMRMISMETGIPFGAMRARKLADHQWPVYINAIEQLDGLPIHLNDMPAITPNQIRYKLRQIGAVHGRIDLVIVDYLQLQGSDTESRSREQEVSSVSRGLKAITKEFDAPVLAAAQLSRAIENRAEKKPQLSDLRESGAIEQDSDIVAFLHTPDESCPSIVDVILAKHRNGPVGKISLQFQATRTKFADLSRRGE